jgi:hypothetical protein
MTKRLLKFLKYMRHRLMSCTAHCYMIHRNAGQICLNISEWKGLFSSSMLLLLRSFICFCCCYCYYCPCRSKLAYVITLLTFIWEVPELNFVRYTVNFDWGLRGFLQFFHTISRIVSQMRPLRLLATSFPIHYSMVIPLFVAIYIYIHTLSYCLRRQINYK